MTTWGEETESKIVQWRERKGEKEREKAPHSQLQSHLPIPGGQPTPQAAGKKKKGRGGAKEGERTMERGAGKSEKEQRFF